MKDDGETGPVNLRTRRSLSSSNDISSSPPRANSLPELKFFGTSFTVSGVAIDPSKTDPQLVCKHAYSGDRSFSVTESEVMQYYQKYMAIIPVLGILGSREDQEDETLLAALEQLKTEHAEARKRMNISRDEEWRNFKDFGAPLKCFARQASDIDGSSLIRKWTNKKGQVLSGIWIGNYSSHNVDGIIVQGVEKKRLYKVPIPSLSAEDAEYIRGAKNGDPVALFGFLSIPVPEDTPLAERFKRLGVLDTKVDVVVFGMKGMPATDYDQAKIESYYVQLFPNGQICELPVEEIGETRDVSYGKKRLADSLPYLDSLQIEVAKKGPTALLAKKYEDEDRSRLARQKSQIEELARGERLKAEQEKQAMELPFLVAYAKAARGLKVALIRYADCEPAKYCDVHKWSERFAPRFTSDFRTEQSKNDYGRNLMDALRAQKEGVIKCSCESKFWKTKQEAAKKDSERFVAEMKKLESEHPEIDFSKADSALDGD